MPSPIRFHLDENVHRALAEGLRRRGVDVTLPIDVGLIGASDEEHLAFAREQDRVLVTHDDDFLRLHRQGISHAGIVYGPPQSRSMGEALSLLLLMHDALLPEDMRNAVEFF